MDLPAMLLRSSPWIRTHLHLGFSPSHPDDDVE